MDKLTTICLVTENREAIYYSVETRKRYTRYKRIGTYNSLVPFIEVDAYYHLVTEELKDTWSFLVPNNL